jgi:hypothetical protein
MDKEFVKGEFDKGWRAYQKTDGKPFFQSQDGEEFKVYGTMDVWHALRAYQDEQRKKGVPITYDSVEDQLPEPYVSEGVMATYLCQFGGGVEIQLAKYKGPRERTYRIARFTNFRWREGYPKETQKQTI